MRPDKIDLPKGWELSLLDKVCNRGSGHTPNKKTPSYWNGGIKWISLSDSNKLDNVYIHNTDKEISQLGINNSSAVLHKKGTVLLSRDAGVGKSAIMAENMAVSQHFIAWECSEKGILDNMYLYYWLQMLKQEFERIAVGSTIKTIGLPYFKKLRLPHPSLPEQIKISSIINTWDKAIEKIERLLDFKKKRKKELMQKLLTGKVRLEQFSTKKYSKEPIRGTGKIPSDWKVLHLHGCTEILMSNVDKKTVAGERPVRLCNYMDIYNNDIVTPEMDFMKATAKDAAIKKFHLIDDDVIITKDSEKPDDIAIPAYIKGTFKNVLCGYHLAILRTQKNVLLGSYLHLVLHLKSYQHYFFSLANGATRFGLGLESIKKAVIFFPSLQEQEKISEFLFSMQREIELLEEEIDVLKKQKKGLMQQLLSGKKRVKI